MLVRIHCHVTGRAGQVEIIVATLRVVMVERFVQTLCDQGGQRFVHSMSVKGATLTAALLLVQPGDARTAGRQTPRKIPELALRLEVR